MQDPNYDVRRIVTLLIAGLRQPQPEWTPAQPDLRE